MITRQSGKANEQCGVKRLLEGLREEHQSTRYILHLINRAAARWEAGEPIAIGLFVQGAAVLQEYAEGVHQRLEEQKLFPLMEREGVLRSGGPLEVLEKEHEECRRYLADLQTALGKNHRLEPAAKEEIVENIKAYTHLLKAHMDKEEMVIFPIAEPLLSGAESSRADWGEELEHPHRHEEFSRLIRALENELGLEEREGWAAESQPRLKQSDQLAEEFLRRRK